MNRKREKKQEKIEARQNYVVLACGRTISKQRTFSVLKTIMNVNNVLHTVQSSREDTKNICIFIDENSAWFESLIKEAWHFLFCTLSCVML